MRILPINNTNYSASRSFGKGVNNQKVVSNNVKRALIPVATLAAMVPSLLNAQTISPEIIQYEEEFVMDDTKYKMVYTNAGFIDEEDAVSEIFFVSKKSAPLKLEQLIKYTDENGNVEVCAKVSQHRKKEKEITLPESIGNELIDLYEGKDDMYVVPGINTYLDLRK